MSSKGKKVRKPSKKIEPREEPKAEEKPAVKPTKEAPRRPKGPAPWPMVSSRHGGGMVERQGRGFSMGELEGAGINAQTAGRWSMSIDVRRRSILEKNVQALKKWSVPPAEVSRLMPAKEAPPKAEKAAEEKPKKRPVRKKTK